MPAIRQQLLRDPTFGHFPNNCFKNMDPKRLPTRLDHDGLNNAIVIVNFSTNYNEPFLVKALIDHNSSIMVDEDLVQIPDPKGDKNNPQYLLANSVYRLQITSASILFNFTRQYTLWVNYLPFIKSCLDILSNYIVCHSAQINYISGFENVSIFDNIDGSISLNYLPRFAGSEFKFSCQVNEKRDHRKLESMASIRITDNIMTGPESTTSIVDISLSGGVKPDSNIIEYIDFLHHHQKNLFFLIVKSQFVDSLGAHYE